MKKRKLGKEGLTVSALGLGCMGMSQGYGTRNDELSLKVIHAAYDQGITFFDTADMYGSGENEKLVGKGIRPFRNQIVLATKCGIEQEVAEHGKGLKINNTPQYIKQCCDQSLKRLNVEVIDLYYLHRHNPEHPIEESMRAMIELMNAGKVRFIGLSEASPETIERAHAVLGNRLIALQSEFSMLNRGSMAQAIPVCRRLGISLVPYSPIARGLLSGKITTTKPFEESPDFDFRTILPQFEQSALDANLHLVNAIEKIATKKNCTPAQLSLAWVLAQGEDIIPIPGTKRLDYLKENIESVNIRLSPDDLKAIEKAMAENPTQGTRYPENLMKLFHLKE